MSTPGTLGTGPVTDVGGGPVPALTLPRPSGAAARAHDAEDDTRDAGTARRAGGRASLLDRRGPRTALAVVVPLGLLGLWHLLTAVTGTFAPYELPSPGAVWRAAVELTERGELGTHVAISTQRVLLGFAIGSAIGLLLGAVVGLSRLGDLLLSGTLGAVRAVPSLAWVPLLLVWLKMGETSKVTLIAIGAFFPVYTTVASALRHVDRHLVEAGRAYGLRGPALLARVQLPAATPAVVSGLRLALAQSWLFLVAAELIASAMGLGFLLNDSQYNGRTDRILLAIVLLAVLGKTTDALIGVVERRLLRRF